MNLHARYIIQIIVFTKRQNKCIKNIIVIAKRYTEINMTLQCTDRTDTEES